ncbi:hypothetical protein AVEN_149108-1 [Araneus ventricosus]|uniref:Uncharacterized protein n=1 Tax=Araneus ventricosus TaxID=182803 RepID=A0A4Y2UAW1_ARAVE|nr:hypothetical protein AVEN_200971-1 [Araneus ventricosus]GBO17080.1 hypothetical protein AVEN_149108-1 [Araneus ventricosus]
MGLKVFKEGSVLEDEFNGKVEGRTLSRWFYLYLYEYRTIRKIVREFPSRGRRSASLSKQPREGRKQVFPSFLLAVPRAPRIDFRSNERVKTLHKVLSNGNPLPNRQIRK